MRRLGMLVMGGGAAGIVAAISAKRNGNSVLLCERNNRLGRKILASGNGRCNLSNDHLDESHYNPEARPIVKSVFKRFGKADISKFFKDLGLEVYSDGSRIFPVTNQSSSVLKVLELELKALSVPVELDFDVIGIQGSADGFLVKSKSGKTIECGGIIMASGGRTYPALGSDGSSYNFAAAFGHRIVEPVPVCVSLVIKERLCHLLQGQRISASAKSLIDRNVTARACGEVLFTKYGLSGSAILDVSRDISIAINRNNKRDVLVSIDMVPSIDTEDLKVELERRLKKNIAGEDVLAGILPNKFGAAFKDLIDSRDAGEIARALKERRFKVAGTRSWNEAEFTSGGVDTSGIKEGTLESGLRKGLYFAGEILDVDGERGGYNLAWAWASGFTAGLAE